MKVSDGLTTQDINKIDHAYYTIILCGAVILGVVGKIYHAHNSKIQIQNQDKTL